MLIGSTHQERLENQLKLWVNGISFHNDIDDECCPDCSCCIPEINTDKLLRYQYKVMWDLMDFHGYIFLKIKFIGKIVTKYFYHYQVDITNQKLRILELA